MHKNSVSTKARILIAVYVVFVTSVLAHACHQHRILQPPTTFKDSMEAVLQDTSYLYDPNPDSMQKVVEDTLILNHSQIKTGL